MKPRKKRNGPPVLLLIFACLLGASYFFAYKEHLKHSPEQNVPIDYSNPYEVYVTGRQLFYDTAVEPLPKDDIWVMYQNLSIQDQHVYDLFLNLVENRDEKDYASSITVSDEQLKIIGESYFWNIYYVMCCDHPELFHLFTNREIISCYYTKSGGYTTYYYSVLPSTEKEKEQMEVFSKATEQFMSQIDLSESDEEIELQVHDKLINLVSYNKELFYSVSDDTDEDLGYTAYGALVCDSLGKENYAVCAGYSAAFQHLMHKAGIPCGYVTGLAYLDSETKPIGSNHAWNVVNIGGRWREVDTTWDDFEYSGNDDFNREFFEQLKSDNEAYYNTLHHFFNRSTTEMANLPATDDTIFNIAGYEPYNSREKTYHIRALDLSQGFEKIEVFSNSLLPVAE